jgi:hypothetical protein
MKRLFQNIEEFEEIDEDSNRVKQVKEKKMKVFLRNFIASNKDKDFRFSRLLLDDISEDFDINAKGKKIENDLKKELKNKVSNLEIKFFLAMKLAPCGEFTTPNGKYIGKFVIKRNPDLGFDHIDFGKRTYYFIKNIKSKAGALNYKLPTDELRAYYQIERKIKEIVSKHELTIYLD